MELPPILTELALPSECLDHQTKSFRMSHVIGNKSDESSSKTERHKSEWPRLLMRHRSFVLASVAEMHWTLQVGHSDVSQLQRTSTSCVPCVCFSTRHFRLRPSGDTLSALSAPVDLLEVFLSRAVELESELRSGGSLWAFVPRIRSRIAWEYESDNEKKSASKNDFQESFFDSPDLEDFPSDDPPLTNTGDYKRACTLQPASYSRHPEPSKINIRVVRAGSADINELRWLLATVVNPEGATLFTQMVERRSKKLFNIVVEGDALPELHKFILADPWRVAWKWVDKLGVQSTALSRVYMAMVGLTWAPVPVAPEASWIYELVVASSARGTDDPAAALDAASSASAEQTAGQVVKHMTHRGFPEFLWNVVRFWQGLSSPLDRQGLNTAPNEDLSGIIALNLKRLSSQFTGEGWMSNVVPISALVAAAWTEVHFKHPLLSYAGGDMSLILPPRVETTVFMVNPEISDVAKAKGEMFINGYRLISQGENKFRLGISSAGLVLSAAFFVKDILDRNRRQRQAWIFDMCRGGVIPSPSLAVLILACHGGNILATYDESYARYFAGMYPFAAVCEYPRSCSYQSLRTKQHRLEFSLLDPEDKRGVELCKLFRSMDQSEGLMHLQCFACSCVLAPADNWPVLLAYMTRPLAVPTRKPSMPCSLPLGWLQMDQISPGQYYVKDLPQPPVANQKPPDMSKTDASKLNFCHQLLRPNDIVEVVPHSYGLTHFQTLDVEPIALPTGVTIESVDINSFKQLPLNSLSIRSTATSICGLDRHRFPPSFVSDDVSSTTTTSPVNDS